MYDIMRGTVEIVEIGKIVYLSGEPHLLTE